MNKEFTFNKNASYQEGGFFKNKPIDIINSDIHVSEDKSFRVAFPNVFEKYKLPHVNSDAVVKQWQTNWLQFWQNQLNFALWTSTAGCGVDYENHLLSNDPMIRSVFNFHVYYQTRRILFEISAALPQQKSWNAFNNAYNQTAYERICGEFNVDKNTDWRQKKSFNDGLGVMYNYWTNSGYRSLGNIWYSKRYSFTHKTTNDVLHVDYLSTGTESNNIWATFILDKSNGFTMAGVERINDSIRTYCWAILGSQSQTRTDIIGTGTAFDAQKQFLANVEDAVQSPVDLPSQIVRYQTVLKYARSKVDFVFGIGLYMAPGDMELRIGTIQYYNNEIVVATTNQKLGLNGEVNTKHTPPPIIVSAGTSTIKHGIPEPTSVVTPVLKSDVIPAKDHENNKTALIVGGIAIGLSSILLYKFFSSDK